MKVPVCVSLAMLAAGAGLFAMAAARGGADGSTIRNGGTFRIAVVASFGMDVDPALPSTQLASLVEATCARLMTYPDKPPRAGYRLVPEVATHFPKVSRDGKTYTFTLRQGRRAFRFSNGAPVRANAFEWAMIRLLKLNTYGASLIQDIVGADHVQDDQVAGIRVTGNRLVIRLTRPAPDFPARLTAPWFCAVPPGLPADPEGVAKFPGAGPYYVAENVRGRRIVLRRNRFYREARPHHVDSFVVDGQSSSPGDVLDRVERGTADWGWAPLPFFLDPERRLLAKYGRNKSRFWLEPGLTFSHYHLNTSRPLFRNNPRLRRAINFAVDRSAVQRQIQGRFGGTLTDQYLPPGLPGFRDAHIYPLEHPDVREARALARGHRRSGKAVLYAADLTVFTAAAQVIKQNLAKIGIDVEIKSFPFNVVVQKVLTPGEPWDIVWAGWTPDYLDPFSYLNSLLDGQFITTNNWSHFDSQRYNSRLRRAARLHGDPRYRAYGRLDVDLARNAAPMVAISYRNEPTLLSKRVDRRCVVLRPTIDLTAVCLKR